jgi:multidrug efflux pump subunit AcrA (membrane-fusion protein)
VTHAQRTTTTLTSGSGSGEISESERLQLDLSVTQAQRDVDDAKTGKDEAIAQAAQAVTDATTARDQAQTALNDAQQTLSTAQGGTNPDTGLPPTAGELDAFEAAVTTAQQALTDAQRALDQATAAQGRVVVDQDRLISDAETNLAIAQASRNERLNPSTDQADAGLSLADARKQLARAQADLAELEASTGTRFPAGELVFVPTLPRRVQTLNTSLGANANGTVMTVTGTETVLRSAVSASDYRLLAEGMEAQIEDAELDIDALATITFLANNPGGGELAADRYAMRLTPNTELPDEALFQSLRLTIPISSTGGEVLAVPLAAVSAASNGDPRVEVQRADGSTELIEVVTGLSAEGFVEITPRGGDLEPGDQVVVGRDLQLPGQDGADDDSDADGDAESDGSEDGEA